MNCEIYSIENDTSFNKKLSPNIYFFILAFEICTFCLYKINSFYCYRNNEIFNKYALVKSFR